MGDACQGSISQTVLLGTLAPPGVLKEEVPWSNLLGKTEFSRVTPVSIIEPVRS